MDELDIARSELASNYIKHGTGIEIGAFGRPVKLTANVNVRYVDKNPLDIVLRQHNLPPNQNLREPDILDDGCVLSSIVDDSLDFIISCHFLEHAEDFIGAMLAQISKLKRGGILFYILPDKARMFDAPRPTIPIAHLSWDHELGTEHSRERHIQEWMQIFPTADIEYIRREPEQIHFHSWTADEQFHLAKYLEGTMNIGHLVTETFAKWPEVATIFRKR